MEREFQVFVKPVGPSCNLQCTYCYYIDNPFLSGQSQIVRMDDDILELYTRQQIEATTEPVITFSWHGGEPMLAGIDFYRKAVTLQKKWCPPGKRVINGIQTNGTLINEEWCRFFAKEQFNTGVSIDGPAELHNLYRKGKDGKGTFGRALHGLDLLMMHGLEPEILCVVSSGNAGFPNEVYDFFRHLGVAYITFIPLVERIDGGTLVTRRSVTPEAFGEFLCTIFDRWLEHDIGAVKIQIIEEALRTAFNQDHTLCVFKPVCGGVPVIEHNGDYYSCDHFVDREHRLGNIYRDVARRVSTISEFLNNEQQISFGRAKFSTLPQYCRKCEVLSMCNGECMKNRFIHTPDGEPGLNYLCKGYRMFFNHCRPFINNVASIFRA